LYTHD